LETVSRSRQPKEPRSDESLRPNPDLHRANEPRESLLLRIVSKFPPTT